MSISALKMVNIKPADEKGYRGTFMADDFVPIESPTGRAKIMASFDALPFDFRFIFKGREKTAPTLEHLQQDVDLKYPNSIQVVYCHNATSRENYMPFTAWILAHRMGHLSMLHTYARNGEVFKAIQKAFLGLYSPDEKEIAKLPQIDQYYPVYYFHDPVSNCMDSDVWRELMPIFMTTRAARKGLIRIAPDTFAELVAQYIITGKVTLVTTDELHRRMAIRLQPNNPTYISSEAAKYLVDLLAHVPDIKLNTMLRALEVTLERELHAWLAKLVGKSLHL